jgi:hypothetical protein
MYEATQSLFGKRVSQNDLSLVKIHAHVLRDTDGAPNSEIYMDIMFIFLRN